MASAESTKVARMNTLTARFGFPVAQYTGAKREASPSRRSEYASDVVEGRKAVAWKSCQGSVTSAWAPQACVQTIRQRSRLTRWGSAANQADWSAVRLRSA